jgi:hypothetical protein
MFGCEGLASLSLTTAVAVDVPEYSGGAVDLSYLKDWPQTKRLSLTM